MHLLDRLKYAAIGVALTALAATLTAANWPSASGTTAPGIVIEDGSGNIAPPSSATLTLSTQSYSSDLVTATRPTNGTAYSINDVYGAANGGGTAAWTFPNMCPAAGRKVYISATQFTIRVNAVPAGMTSFRLYLYNATPPSAIADNSPFDLAAGDLASYQGYIDLGSPVDLGSNLYVQLDGIQHPVICGASTSLFGYTVTNTAFTPGSGDVSSLILHAVSP